MEEYSTNWLDLLGDNPRIPADIHFKVIEKTVVEGRIETFTEVFKAHKFVLAMFSDVFQAQFYGPMGSVEEEVLVEETSIAAFKRFLRIIYSLHLINRIRITIKDVELHYEILNLAKKYLNAGAIILLEEAIASMSLTAAEAIPTAIIADKYHKLLGFESVSEKLLKNCSARLNAPLTSLKKMREFLTKVESEYSGENLKLILRLIAGGAEDSPDIDFEADDDEARQTFCCKHCNVKLHDLVAIESHLKGKPHLMQQQRLKDNQQRIAAGDHSGNLKDFHCGDWLGGNTSRFASPANLNMKRARPRSGSLDCDVWNGGYNHSGSYGGYSSSPGRSSKSFYANEGVKNFGLALSPPATKPFKPQSGLIFRAIFDKDKKSI